MKMLALEACPECDLLLQAEEVQIGVKAHCPRCACLLYRPRKQSIERTLALSLTGLILFVPANLLPLVGIKILGSIKDCILWDGVASLYYEGMWAVAVLVFLASMGFPLCKIVLSLLLSAHLYARCYTTKLWLWMRWLQHLEEWAMLEVYTLGIIVACVKLSSMSELRFGFGLYAFVSLLLVAGMLSTSLDEHQFWRNIESLALDSVDDDLPTGLSTHDASQ